jgi:hypothetical protein
LPSKKAKLKRFIDMKKTNGQSLFPKTALAFCGKIGGNCTLKSATILPQRF